MSSMTPPCFHVLVTVGRGEWRWMVMEAGRVHAVVRDSFLTSCLHFFHLPQCNKKYIKKGTLSRGMIKSKTLNLWGTGSGLQVWSLFDITHVHVSTNTWLNGGGGREREGLAGPEHGKFHDRKLYFQLNDKNACCKQVDVCRVEPWHTLPPLPLSSSIKINR